MIWLKTASITKTEDWKEWLSRGLKRTKLEKQEEQLQTSTVENNLLFDTSVDADEEFLHNVSKGNSFMDLGFEFDGIDNKENDNSNSSKCKAYMLLIISYHNCYIINYFFNP